MCGIAGIVSTNPSLVSKQRILEGISSLHHRGPEGDGLFMDTNIVLAHKRLCIIDLSQEAAQPFVYQNRFQLVYNGELYNYRELRNELIKKGFSFRTASDTEVIVAAYAAYGRNCLQHFDGMFAFAIWDTQEEKLFAARDRMGEKPFFYYYDGEQFIFASEIKAFWKMNIRKEVNPSMLYNFLSIGYTANPSDPQETFFENIHKLPAAHFLEFSFSEKELSIERYWQVEVNTDHNITEQQAVDKFMQLMHSSVQMRMRSDVPVGTSLSGGLDSSTIVALCNEARGEPYSHKCFTATFEGFEKDESRFASMVANKFGLEHFTTTIEAGEVPDLMEKIVIGNDEPVSTSSPLAQYKVYGLAASNGVKVVLDGQGADEILAGYHKYFRWYWMELYRQKKLGISGEIQAARKIGIDQDFGWGRRLAAGFPDLAGALWQSRQSKLASKNEMFNPDFAFRHKRDLYYSLPATNDLNGALYFNSFVIGLEELLRMADRNSMAHSVEVRLPFLQYQLVEYLFTLPSYFKIRNGWTKWLLRKSMENLLPAEITWRKDKTGFEPPQKKWMEHAGVKDAIHEARKKLVNEKILHASIFQKQIRPHDAHVAGSGEWKIWSAALLYNN
jgi:asparagine synthase (glutamine-hydrolysing)